MAADAPLLRANVDPARLFAGGGHVDGDGVATLPLLLVIDGLSFTDAYFETMSGMTTTGATVLTGLDNCRRRSTCGGTRLNWLGGMGIIVLAVAVLPLLGIGGRQLFKAETPGPMKDSALTPRIAETARNLWVVYLGITLSCIAALKWAGMNWLDAICHAFAALSLGGFSTHDASVGHFNSPLIEFVLIVFMLIAAINFASHFLAWRGETTCLSARPSDRDDILVLGSYRYRVFCGGRMSIRISGRRYAAPVSIWCRWRRTAVCQRGFNRGRFCAAVDVVLAVSR